jgi:solute carrier family 25 citrate transporter 1
MADTITKKPQLSPFVKGFAGSLGGVAEACLLQPIDVIKTRIQLDKVGKYKGIVQTGQVMCDESESVCLVYK